MQFELKSLRKGVSTTSAMAGLIGKEGLVPNVRIVARGSLWAEVRHKHSGCEMIG